MAIHILRRGLALCGLIVLLIILLTGCETLKDKRKTLHEHRETYCSKTADPTIKKAAILAIKAEFPLYPTEGICIGITEDGC